MKKSLFGPFSQAFVGAAGFQGQIGATHPITRTIPSIPIDVVQAADDVLDIFSMYKLLGADGRNAAYWPERRTLLPDGMEIERPTAVATLYHATLEEFAAYKKASDRGIDREAIMSFRKNTNKLEVMISQGDEGLIFAVERHCGQRIYYPRCGAKDDVMLSTMGFVRETSPKLTNQIGFLEKAWLDFPDDGIALNL